MLKELCIKNFTLIKQTQVSFDQGMTVLTGETGAGKSIIIGALNLLLGHRADPKQIADNAEHADISASFTTNSDAETWLQAHQLDDKGNCIIRRVLSRQGKSKAYINGTATTIQQLKSLGQHLVNIHAQHEHHALLKPDYQLNRLDHYANHAKLLAAVAEGFDQWQETDAALKRLHKQQQEQQAQHQLLQYQHNELAALNLVSHELDDLHQEQQRLSHAQQIIQTCAQASDDIYISDQSIISRLYHWQKQLSELPLTDQELTEITSSLGQVIIQLEDSAKSLDHYGATVNIDEQRLQQVEQRLSELYDMARKHQVQPAQLLTHYQTLSKQLSDFTSLNYKITQTTAQLKAKLEHYQQQAKRLTRSRFNAAQQLADAVTTSLKQLGIEGGKLTIALPERQNQPHRQGAEQAQFLVQTNHSQCASPMQEIVSGGELSRISLAIQVLTAKQQTTPTLIFDEVDVGIGGGTAEIVGQLLRQLGRHCQVLCITHLAQVAAQGHSHIHVHKYTDNETKSEIKVLDQQSRTEEIARMIGGITMTEQTREYAKEILARVSQ